mmetsp:Transcript_25228/g.79157  ORF Transcript_25228/g.79157 Transcript_25228/m.79157 type:complete len:216 (+) Transcript_25228:1319-1966(+)
MLEIWCFTTSRLSTRGTHEWCRSSLSTLVTLLCCFIARASFPLSLPWYTLRRLLRLYLCVDLLSSFSLASSSLALSSSAFSSLVISTLSSYTLVMPAFSNPFFFRITLPAASTACAAMCKALFLRWWPSPSASQITCRASDASTSACSAVATMGESASRILCVNAVFNPGMQRRISRRRVSSPSAMSLLKRSRLISTCMSSPTRPSMASCRSTMA